MTGRDRYISELESIRLSNLQITKTVLSRKSHWTDDELNGVFLRQAEDLVKISFILKRMLDPFSS